ncbi:MAG: SpoIIE family protein phosphatase [Treponema sp.]|nr:SpoIIE family protein phosphatase [Treponema sp.]
MGTTTIDAFIKTPLIVVAAMGALLLLFLVLIQLRNTAKPSFIFYISAGVLTAGALFALATQHIFNFIVAVAFSVVILIPYSILKAFDNPQKREEKKAAKKLAEQKAAIENSEVTKAAIAAIEAKNQRLLEVNKDLVAQVSTFFSRDNSMESFLEYCNTMISEKISADGCVILISDDYDNMLAVKSLKGSFPPPYKLPEDLPHKPIRVETNLRFAQFPLKDNIFGEIFSGGEPVLITDSVRDPRIYQNGPEDFLKCGSYIFVPIRQQEGVVGLIALTRLPGKAKFTKEDFDTAIILTDAVSSAMKPLYSFLAYAEHAELSKDGTIASKYQKDLQPAKLPVIPSATIGCFSNTVEGVCGDYYDVLISRKDRISFVMTDVAGKGMNSLVVMIMIRAILRLTTNTEQSAATILSWANRGICLDSSKIDHFASVALINYNSNTNEAQIATCGNNPVFHFVASEQKLNQISIPSEPMGVEKNTVYTDINLKLNSGDILITCTDGVIEALNENGAQYAKENLTRVVLKNCNASAKDISNKVKDDLRKYCGTTQQYDDQSLLVIKIQ